MSAVIEPEGGIPKTVACASTRSTNISVAGNARLVNYAARYRAGMRVGTAMTEGTANFLVNRRMNKSQQMRWSRRGADLVLQVRCAVYNGTLGFRLRPTVRTHRPSEAAVAIAAYRPTSFWTLLCGFAFLHQNHPQRSRQWRCEPRLRPQAHPRPDHRSLPPQPGRPGRAISALFASWVDSEPAGRGALRHVAQDGIRSIVGALGHVDGP